VPSTWSRRSFLAITAGLAVTAAACSREKPGEVAKDGSVTIKHAFGETKIPGPPKRVVSAGYAEQDDILAAGVLPVAVTDWFGNQPFGVWPWAQPKLGSAQPVVLDLSNGIQVDQIATLKPDLIIATNAGLDADTYAKLAAIAPTVPQSGQDAFFEPWKDQATTIGQALFKDAEMRKLISDIDDEFVAAGKSNASFSGKKVFVVRGAIGPAGAEITPAGWRTEYLTQMGFAVGDGIDDYVKGDVALVSRDRMASVLDTADVLIWTTESDDERTALLADPTFTQLRATKTNRNVVTGKDLAGAIAFATVLSYPVVADQLPPLIAKVLT
jgi:iron complex transport system substrate-binding protein